MKRRGKRYQHGWAYWLSSLGYLAIAALWLYTANELSPSAIVWSLSLFAAVVMTACALREIFYFFRDLVKGQGDKKDTPDR